MTPSQSANRIQVPLIIYRISKWLDEFDVGQLAQIQTRSLDDKVQYRHKHRSIKSKGGHRPQEFNIVDDLVDLGLAIKQGRYDEAIKKYFYIRRLVDGPKE